MLFYLPYCFEKKKNILTFFVFNINGNQDINLEKVNLGTVSRRKPWYSIVFV